MASWNEFVLTTGPTATIGPKAIYTTDAPFLKDKFSTDVMGSVPIAGHYLDGDLAARARGERIRPGQQ